jgi:hypothetical protein
LRTPPFALKAKKHQFLFAAAAALKSSLKGSLKNSFQNSLGLGLEYH